MRYLRMKFIGQSLSAELYRKTKTNKSSRAATIQAPSNPKIAPMINIIKLQKYE